MAVAGVATEQAVAGVATVAGMEQATVQVVVGKDQATEHLVGKNQPVDSVLDMQARIDHTTTGELMSVAACQAGIDQSPTVELVAACQAAVAVVARTIKNS